MAAVAERGSVAAAVVLVAVTRGAASASASAAVALVAAARGAPTKAATVGKVVGCPWWSKKKPTSILPTWCLLRARS
jgi:hypothetical protein